MAVLAAPNAGFPDADIPSLLIWASIVSVLWDSQAQLAVTVTAGGKTVNRRTSGAIAVQMPKSLVLCPTLILGLGARH